MTLRSISRSLVVLFVLPLVMTLVACGSANELSPEPQPSDLSGAPMQPVTTDARPAATVSRSTPTPDLMPTTEAIGRVLDRSSESSLQDLIIGNWIPVSGDAQDEFAFSFNGQYSRDSTVPTGTYEVMGQHSVRIQPFEGNEFIVSVVDISHESMVVIGLSDSDAVTLARVNGATNLAQDVIGYWRFAGAVPDQDNPFTPEVWYSLMGFNADGSFVSTRGWESGTAYEVYNNSMIVVRDPAKDYVVPIRIDGLDENKATVRFEFAYPAISFEKLREDEGLTEYLVGLWREALESGTNESNEFTQDGRLISQLGVGWYRVFDDSSVLTAAPGSQPQLWKLLIESDEIAQFVPGYFDDSSLSLVFDTNNAVTLTRVK